MHDVIYDEKPLGPPPPATSEATTKTMKANVGKNTGPELLLRNALREVGLQGYRLHWKKIPGRPDISYPGKKVAIFVNGCFWHRCPHCNLPVPKSNTEFWMKKFRKNIKRDEYKRKELEELGWKVFTFWECKIKENPKKCANLVSSYFEGEFL